MLSSEKSYHKILPHRGLWATLSIVVTVASSVRSQQCPAQSLRLTSTDQVLNITSPNYPGAFQPGSSCRFQVTAPLDHVVELRCFYELYPNICDGSEYFQISRDGDPDFRDGEAYCRTSSIQAASHFRTIRFAHMSVPSASASSQRGRYFCQAVARPQRCDCGWTPATKITNGQEAARHEFPSMVALRDVSSSQRIFCGGSIVTHRIILTAAHCADVQPNPLLLRALVGDHDLTTATESRYAVQHSIQSILKHPGYSATSLANDIAVLVTQRNIEWTRGVGPICLPFRQAAESFPYVNVDVAGWGTVVFAGSKSDTLQKADLLTMDNRVCQMQYNDTTILPSQLCTYDYRGLGQDSCQYDSGGPVIFRQHRQFLLGIISFGRTCGTPYAIGVNTRVTAHLNWLWSYVVGGACVA